MRTSWRFSVLPAALICAVVFLLISCGSTADTGNDEECEGISCSGHGTCVVVEGEPTCACDEGYEVSGLNCVDSDDSSSDTSDDNTSNDSNDDSTASCEASCPDVCDDGKCVECADDYDCDGGEICSDNSCVECEYDSDCQDGVCHAGSGNCPITDHEGACQSHTDEAYCSDGVCNCVEIENGFGEKCQCEWDSE